MEEKYFGILAGGISENLVDGYSIDDLRVTGYEHYGFGTVVELGDKEYLVVEEDELDELAEAVVLETLWAFNTSYLSSMTGEDQEVFDNLSGMYEGANNVILSIIKNTCGVDEFVESAIAADGYGHFISHYDGYMHESEYEGDYYYIFRMM